MTAMSDSATSSARAGVERNETGSRTITRPGTLYVVATPIGNMGDLGSRASGILASTALIAAEDTRHTGQLLMRLGVETPLVSLHEHNEAGRIAGIIARLRGGDSVALVSDAGTPLISDPGYRLLAAVREAGLPVSPVPGPCAATAALSVAGLPTDRFHFEGFLPARGGARVTRLKSLADREETLVFYESANRLGDTLQDAITVLGADRAATVCRELTKLHETIYRGTLAEVRAAVLADPGGDRGECTWVVAGRAEAVGVDEAELSRVVRILAAELPAAQAAALAAKLTGATRKAAYRLASRETSD